MNLEIIILSEVNQTRERQISYDMVYMWYFKKMIQMIVFMKQKQTHRQNKFMVMKGERLQTRTDWEFGVDIYTTVFK